MTIGSVGATRTTGAPQVVDPQQLGAASGPRGEARGAIDLGRDHIDGSAPRRAREAERSAPAQTSTLAGARPSEATRGAAEAFARGGTAGLDGWMDAHPRESRELLTRPRDDIQREVRTTLEGAYADSHLGGVQAWWNADAIVDRIAQRATPSLREAVRVEASVGLDARIEALRSASPESLVRELRAAAPGSPAAALAAEVGVRGNEMDVERVATWRERALDQLGELRGTLQGQTWNPDELPGSTARVAARLGLDRAQPGSIAQGALQRGLEAADVAHRGQEVIEVGHLLAEGVEAALHGASMSFAVGLPLGLGSLAFGLALHHQIGVNRGERRDVAERFGL